MIHTTLRAAVLLFAAALANAQSPATDNEVRQQPQQVNVPSEQSTLADDKTQQQASASILPAATETASEKQVDRKPAGTVEARFDARYTELRRGHDQEIAILLCPPREFVLLV
jgi:hypothetical protein